MRINMHGTKDRPRLFVFRSNQHIYAQLVNDDSEKILASVSDKDLKAKKGNKSELSKQVGMLIAEKAKESKIEKVIFDRGGNLFHGRVKSLADGAREGGLQF